MNSDVLKYVQEMSDYKKKMTSSKEKSLEFLVKAGIADVKGNLMPQYSNK